MRRNDPPCSQVSGPNYYSAYHFRLAQPTVESVVEDKSVLEEC
jgi:hypothetical protein